MSRQITLNIRNNIEQNDRFFNPDFVRKYSDKHKKMSLKFAELIAGKLQRVNFKEGKILDTGCGSGYMLIELAKKIPAAEFYGIDFSTPMIETAGKNKRNSTGKISFLKADILDLPFRDKFFNLVLNINMLHLIKQPVKMLNEINRVVIPDGFFFITDLKKSILGFIEKEIKEALSVKDTINLIAESELPIANFSSDLIWWHYNNL